MRPPRDHMDVFDAGDRIDRNRNGNTDFEVEQGCDPIEMEYHAIEIVLHFVQMAIHKPLLGLVV